MLRVFSAFLVFYYHLCHRLVGIIFFTNICLFVSRINSKYYEWIIRKGELIKYYK